MKNLVIAGGSGFLGNAITAHFQNQFNTITILTRGKSKTKGNVNFVTWDAKSLGNWQHIIDGSDVLINMTGRSVDCRYTERNKKIILDSRVDATKILGEAIIQSKNPPKIWLNSSTATIYRHSLDKEMDETTGEIGEGFSVHVAKSWEEAFFSIATRRTRKVALRTSIVLGRNGGALQPIKNLSKIGFGGKQGNGDQAFSWIHLQDFVKSIDFIIQNEVLEGPVNIVAPKPTTNSVLMKTVRNAIGIPFGVPLPKWVLEIGSRIIQTETELVLKSRNVIPAKLLSQGYTFDYPELKDALKDAI